MVSVGNPTVCSNPTASAGLIRNEGTSEQVADLQFTCFGNGGLATIQAMRVAGASALSIDAGKTLMFDREAMLASANEAGISIIGREK